MKRVDTVLLTLSAAAAFHRQTRAKYSQSAAHFPCSGFAVLRRRGFLAGRWEAALQAKGIQ